MLRPDRLFSARVHPAKMRAHLPDLRQVFCPHARGTEYCSRVSTPGLTCKEVTARSADLLKSRAGRAAENLPPREQAPLRMVRAGKNFTGTRSPLGERHCRRKRRCVKQRSRRRNLYTVHLANSNISSGTGEYWCQEAVKYTQLEKRRANKGRPESRSKKKDEMGEQLRFHSIARLRTKVAGPRGWQTYYALTRKRRR